MVVIDELLVCSVCTANRAVEPATLPAVLRQHRELRAMLELVLRALGLAEQPQDLAVRVAVAVVALVERFDIEPFPDFSAK